MRPTAVVTGVCGCGTSSVAAALVDVVVASPSGTVLACSTVRRGCRDRLRAACRALRVVFPGRLPH